MTYLTKCIIAFGISVGISVVLGPILIPMLRKLKFGQSVRDDGPQSHLQKQGTPTMGGVMFFLSLGISVLVMATDYAQAGFLLLFALGFGCIGFLDDYIKIIKKRSLGLTAKQKMLGQLMLSVILCVLAIGPMQIATTLSIPFTRISFDLGWLYVPFFVFIAVGTTNAVNLTDGLDGLASGVTLCVALGFALIGLMANHAMATIFAMALAGCCLGFLFFNKYPAKVFMGDTGSLALGGAVAALAVITKTELFLPIIGIIYVAEVVSDIIQVAVYKRKKVRVFKMAPIHHHFELCGWKETKVVAVFVIVTIFAVAITVFGYALTMIEVL